MMMVVVDTSLEETRIMLEGRALTKLGNVGMKLWELVIASLAFLTKKEDVLVLKDSLLDSCLTSHLFSYPRTSVIKL